MAKQQDTERSAESRAEPDGKAPSSQVISVRLPASLADDVSEMAAQRGLRSSDLVKVAVEEYIRQTGIAAIRANTTGNLKVGPEITSFNSENSNPVEYPADVEIAGPPDVVALGL